MIIANVKSAQDLQSKRTLQQQLLDLEVSNEAELEKRVKDYKNPNKPIPVAPEYKTNAELQKDKIAQERQAIKNMEELGFDYAKSAELVAWLSSSLINKLVEFNANYKGIKKELTETTNPKLINLDFLKNYLEKYFEDIDINYGRKFSKDAMSGSSAPATIDELGDIVPNNAQIRSVLQLIGRVMENVRRQTYSEITAEVEASKRFLEVNKVSPAMLERFNERDRRDYNNGRRVESKKVEDGEKYLSFIRELLPKLRYGATLLDLYSVVLPSYETFNLLKTGLTQQERSDVIRRYITILKSIQFLSKAGVDELGEEIDSIESRDPIELDALNRFNNKLMKSLSFLTKEKGADAISKLQRDIEVLLNQNGKMAELDEIKSLNDIREKRIREAEVAVKEAQRPNIEEAIDTADLREGRVVDERDGDEYQSRVDIGAERDRMREREEDIERMREIQLEISSNRERNRERIRQGLEEKEPPLYLFEPDVNRPPPPSRNRERQQVLRNIQELTNQFAMELDTMYYGGEGGAGADEGSAINTAKGFLKQYAGKSDKQLGQRKGAGEDRDDYFERLKQMIQEYAEAKHNRLSDRMATGDITEPAEYDYIANLERARIYNRKNVPTADTSTYGVGLKKALKQHFREDEAEMKNMARELRRHKAVEKKIDAYAKGEDSSDDEKKGGGSHLGFRHRKVKVGKGISVKEQPSYKTFGKYVIHMGHLLDKNVANFKYPSLGSIPHIKPLTISEDYKEFILDTIKDGRPNDRVFHKLPTEEQRHFERVVAGAGLVDTFKLKRNHTEQERKEAERFNLLRGEVLAGNNSDKVMKELRSLIVRFMNEGRIQQKEGTTMLLELSSI
jgi:hypothetical protein